MNKISIISGFLGSIKNRYMTYQEDRPIEQKIRMAAEVDGVDGLELCYPQDFSNATELKSLMKKYGLGVSAINFRSRRTGQWMRGSFSSQIASERREVVEDMKKAIDMAADMGCDRVSTCPLNEGHDYPFELDYAKAYDYMEDSIGQAALHNPDVRISIEYKQNDPRARCLLGNAGETLAFCQKLGLPNVGVTLDIGHAIQAGERPAQSAIMLARENRLFYVHLNDNDKFWDWDMIPGAFNFWDFIEFFYYLREIGYDDWFAFDIYPKEIDTVKTFEVAVSTTRKLIEISKRLDPETIKALLENRDPADSMKYLYTIL